MKARVIETGEIVDLQTNHMDEFFTKDGVRFIGLELDFDFDYQPDYWKQLKHQYTGMFLAGMLANSEWEGTYERLSEIAIEVAEIHINRLKEEKK